MMDRTVQRMNIAAAEVKQSPESPDGFRPGAVRLGRLMGAANTGMIVVVEGEAVPVTDDDLLERLAEAWAKKWDGRWHYKVDDGAFRHEGGTGAVLVFSVTPAKILAFAKGTFGQTRHRF